MKLKRVEPNLYIQTNASGSESWIARFYANGKETYRGLGDVRYVTRKQAREDAHAIRMALKTGAMALQVRKAPTFAEILGDAMTDLEATRKWKNKFERRTWIQSITDVALPTIGKLHVDEIETDHILEFLKPVWGTVLAGKVRSRVEAILNWCILKRYRKGPNPASWKGNLDLVLPGIAKVHKTAHLMAPTIEEVREIVKFCRYHPGTASGAILLIIATAGRVSECLEITRKEIQGDVWTIPEERMKAGVEHRVPLTDLAKEGISMGAPTGEVIFPGTGHKFMANDTPRIKIRRIVGRMVTAHGIRSTFKDWCSREGIDEILSEKALAHAWGSQVTRAYQRDDLLERRKEVMERWAKAVGEKQ